MGQAGNGLLRRRARKKTGPHFPEPSGQWDDLLVSAEWGFPLPAPADTFSDWWLSPNKVRRTFHREPRAVHDVGVNHRRRHVAVAQKLLNGPDIVTRFQKMRGKGVAKGMRSRPLGDGGSLGGFLDRSLQAGFINVAAADHPASGVFRELGRWKYVLPSPLLSCIRVFASQRRPDVGTGKTRLTVRLKELSNAGKMLLRPSHRLRQTW